METAAMSSVVYIYHIFLWFCGKPNAPRKLEELENWKSLGDLWCCLEKSRKRKESVKQRKLNFHFHSKYIMYKMQRIRWKIMHKTEVPENNRKEMEVKILRNVEENSPSPGGGDTDDCMLVFVIRSEMKASKKHRKKKSMQISGKITRTKCEKQLLSWPCQWENGRGAWLERSIRRRKRTPARKISKKSAETQQTGDNEKHKYNKHKHIKSEQNKSEHGKTLSLGNENENENENENRNWNQEMNEIFGHVGIPQRFSCSYFFVHLHLINCFLQILLRKHTNNKETMETRGKLILWFIAPDSLAHTLQDPYHFFGLILL